MKPEDQIFEQIEGYLSNNMDSTQKVLFEKMLLENPEIDAKVKAHQLANDMVIESRLLSVNDLLVSHHQSQRGMSKGLMLGIASLLTTAGIGALLYFNNGPASMSYSEPKTHIGTSENAVSLPTPSPAKPEETTPKSNTTLSSESIPAKPHEGSTSPTSPTHTTLEKPESSVTEPIVSIKEETTLPTVPENGTQQPMENPAKQPVTDKCAGVLMKVLLSQAQPCHEEANGRLWISEAKGGTAPYNIQVWDEQHNKVQPQQLSAGKYKVLSTDANGCTSQQSVTLAPKMCDKDLIFNPFSGDQLELPVYKHDGALKIFDRQGNLYASMSIPANTALFWNGQSKNGELNEGFYNFVIEYSDLMVTKGTITVVR